MPGPRYVEHFGYLDKRSPTEIVSVPAQLVHDHAVESVSRLICEARSVSLREESCGNDTRLEVLLSATDMVGRDMTCVRIVHLPLLEAQSAATNRRGPVSGIEAISSFDKRSGLKHQQLTVLSDTV